MAEEKRLPALPEQDEEAAGRGQEPVAAPSSSGYGVKSYLHLLYERVRSQSGSQSTTPVTTPASPETSAAADQKAAAGKKPAEASDSGDEEDDCESQAESEYRMLLNSFESATRRRRRKGIRVFLIKLLLISSILALVFGLCFLAFAFFYPKVSPVILAADEGRQPHMRFTLFDPAILRLQSRLETLKIVAIATISSSMLVITLILLLPSLLLYYRNSSSGNVTSNMETASGSNSRTRRRSENKHQKSKLLAAGETGSGCGHEDVFRLTQEISQIQPKD